MCDLSYLLVFSLNLVTIVKAPFSLSFWLIMIEMSLEMSSIRKNPFSFDEVSRFPSSEHLHASLEEDKGSFSFLESVFPES